MPTWALPRSERYDCAIAPWTLRRRRKHLGLVCKRPRYFYSEKHPPRAQKKGGLVRRLKHLPPEAVWLLEEEPSLRLFPGLRRAWSRRGEQAIVPITGNKATRVLFGTRNPRTGHRLVLRCRNMRQASFQAFLRLLRHSDPGRPIWLLLDEAPCHIAPKSQAFAALLHIQLIGLPKQGSELNAMDHLWRALKEKISASYHSKLTG